MEESGARASAFHSTLSDEEQQMGGGERPQAQAPKLPDLSAKKLKKLKEKYDRRGIVYISRIPPHLVRQQRRRPHGLHGSGGRRRPCRAPRRSPRSCGRC